MTAQEYTSAQEEIPLLSEVIRPVWTSRFTSYIHNLRALHHVNWTPNPVSVLIGANGVGKTTLLLTLKLMSVAYDRGLSEAVNLLLGGGANLRYRDAAEDDPIEVDLEIGSAVWRIQIIPSEGSVSNATKETLFDGEHEVFSRDSLGGFTYAGERIEATKKLGLRTLMDRGVHDPALRSVAIFLQHISIYYDPNLRTLREDGSKTTEHRRVSVHGTNVLAVLRRWRDDRANEHRYRFVIEGLSAAFPNCFEELDFVEAGTTLAARVYQPGTELATPLESEANGVLHLLVLLTEVAAAEDESVVAIDEPENSLHPYALRTFLRRTQRWARQHNLMLLLSTHSTVLLDELSGSPDQVYVMKSAEPGKNMPIRLDDLWDPDWLAGFSLGDLYEQGEIGSNQDGI